jgi:hypothetical protein
MSADVKAGATRFVVGTTWFVVQAVRPAVIV